MSEPALHALLGRFQHPIADGHCCYILWDMRKPPTTEASHVAAPAVRLSPAELAEHATAPPTNELRIICDVLPVPWPIVARNPTGVTIGDVLDAVFAALNVQILPHEWEQLPQKQRARVEAAFGARCSGSADPSNMWKYGITRADTLLAHVFFAGLSTSPDEDDVCVLTLRRWR